MDMKKPSPDISEDIKSDEPSLVLEPEIGGFADQGLKEPTRYGDWEVKGRCSDF